MILKALTPPLELKILRYLKKRMIFPVKSENYYYTLEKGFTGEKIFEGWLSELLVDCIILHDLLFEVNNTIFQIDVLVIFEDQIYLFEVKNYEGDFHVDEDKWYTLPNTEIKNPLYQLKRSESLVRRLLQTLESNLSIDNYLTFVNPEFYLYKTPLNLPILFPSQLNRFINQLNLQTSKLNDTHKKLADQLLSRHLSKSPFTRLPVYTYEQLEKGIPCKSCNSFLPAPQGKTILCNDCGCVEVVSNAVLRCIEEYTTLFPNRKITTKEIFNWCKIIKSKKTLRSILSKNYRLIGHGKSAHFIISIKE
jgi:hypothetical protein